MSENVLPMISSGNFMVLCLKLKSLSNFEFIFVYGERVCSNFIDLQAAVQLYTHTHTHTHTHTRLLKLIKK